MQRKDEKREVTTIRWTSSHLRAISETKLLYFHLRTVHFRVHFKLHIDFISLIIFHSMRIVYNSPHVPLIMIEKLYILKRWQFMHRYFGRKKNLICKYGFLNIAEEKR